MCKDLTKLLLDGQAEYPAELQAAYEKAVRTGGVADLNDFLAKRRIWREGLPPKLAEAVEIVMASNARRRASGVAVALQTCQEG